MDTNCLEVTVEATHESLRMRLEEATRHRGNPRETRSRIDAFIAATSRHLGAVEEVLVPAARRLPGGREAADDYLLRARRLEAALAQLKARSYGELHAAYLSMGKVWEDVRHTLGPHDEAERRLVAVLVGESTDAGPEVAERLASRVYRAELKAPTRAHPHLPHTGFAGRAARRVWALADRFWDTTENRDVPPPVRPQRRVVEHESLVRQYLTGGPTFDADAPLVEHRRRRT